MNNAELDIAIKANADQVLSAIKKVTGRLDELSTKINSLPAGDKQLNKLSREFARTSITQQKLIDNFDKLSTTIPQAESKIVQVGNSSKGARTALTSLSLTIQDLPFGFLGIQNNLPGVIQGFGNLTATTNGKVVPALKEIGKSLLGPAGIFLAFSAVTSVITILIQKYGSLGAAIDSLFNKQTALSAELKKANDNYQEYIKNQRTVGEVVDKASTSQSGQIAIVQSLTKKATDLTLSQTEQKNALLQLQQISSDYYGNLKTGASNTDAIKESTIQYTKALQAKSKIEQFSNQISDIDFQLSQQKRFSTQLKNTRDSANAVSKANFNNATALNKLGIATFYTVGATEKANEQYNANTTAINSLNAEKKIYNDLLNQEIDALNQVVVDTKEHNKQTKEGERYIHEFSKAYMDWTNRLWNAPYVETARNLDALNFVMDKIAQSSEVARMATDSLTGSLKNLIDEGFEDIKRQTDLSFGLKTFTENTFDNIGIAIKNFLSNIKTVYPILQSTFVSPLEDAFKGFLDTGKFAFKEFTKVVLDSIKQIVARLVATGIVASLAILLSGGFAAGTGVTGLKTLGAALLGSVGANTGGQLGLRNVSNPNFGGVGPGGMSMSGSVSLSLRGSDLVGAINRTNTNINRIG
jgi:hypothetical protein